MEKAINDAILDIDEEIEELKARKSLLKNIQQDLSNPNLSDAEKWCILRETPVRWNKDEMLKLAKTFIPDADEYLYDVNDVKLRMGKIYVSIPTTKSCEIDISYNGMLVRKYPDMEEPSKEEKFLDRYLGLLNYDVSTLELAKYAYPGASLLTHIVLSIRYKKKLRDSGPIAERLSTLREARLEKSQKMLNAYTTFSNEVSRFDALMYDKLKAFAGDKFKINRNGVWY